MALPTPIPTLTEINISSLIAGLITFTFFMMVLFGYVVVMAAFLNKSVRLLSSAIS